MENQTRFDLNAAIESWRQELAAQPNLTSDDRRELETHLRDAITGFQQRGLNEEESFWLARRRVGQPQQLSDEFAKADPAKVWRERVFWMWLAVCLLIFLGRMFRDVELALQPVIPPENSLGGKLDSGFNADFDSNGINNDRRVNEVWKNNSATL